MSSSITPTTAITTTNSSSDYSLNNPFSPKKHISLHVRHLHLLPNAYQSAGADAQRITLAYFALSAIDLLSGVPHDAARVDDEERREWRDWIWDRQVASGGFVGSPVLQSAKEAYSPSSVSIRGDLAQTYTALLALGTLRDEEGLKTRLDKDALCALLSQCQQQDGSFRASPEEQGSDVRFVFCAFAIAHLLGQDGWRAIDLQKTLGYLGRCRTFDGAFGQSPGEESHAGSTYCVLASLRLGGQLHTWLSPAEQQKTVHWLSHRQDVTTGGLAGRLNKETDVCYSFWVGASLAILGHHDLLDASADVRWILSAQSRVGGFGKVPDEPPDLLHSYLGLAALALHAHDDEQDNARLEADGPSEQHESVDAETRSVRNELGKSIQPLDAAINLRRESADWLRRTLRSSGRTAT
ncbi:terpenoid cyclases/Protein prenyltransferase [Ceraceosorus guamensis]|uniref:Terpenoid cyclases/Protein prenyltransferase n=1 Tax=Ceraceosorus guamensis TaxID=1522189 RepID=A0A316VQM8_9BASI|nr:terpenoid cyclases/Protein prenyltransferase [Ceraceosorus guamensis]PWN39907.1 terpenoid cyclases/Protein prenyltransferase [Ceraceosorus guamensis]